MKLKWLLFMLACAVFTQCNSNNSQQDQNEKLMDTSVLNTTFWIHQTNVYEVNLRQYTAEGTLNAFVQHLPRLKAMGVETLWFMPITPIAQKNKKGNLGSYYAAADYTSVSPEFGTMDDFKKLVAQAHEMGFKVIIDWVANHTGWDHKWTLEHPDFYEKDSATGTFKIASGMDDIIELDYKNPQLRKAMIDAMLYWIKEADIDGFRCDLATWVELDFWQEAKPELEKTKKLFWLGEFDALENPEYLQVFDAAYCWTWMHKTEDFYKGKTDLATLKELLNRYDSACGNNKMTLWFTTNHDENSWNGTEYEKYGDMAQALAVLSFTWNGIPLIYSGQELPNKKRLKFFEKDTIEWNRKFELQNFYHTLLALRKSNVALSAGDPSVRTYLLKTRYEDKVLAYLRKNGKKEVLVLLNFSKDDLSFTIESEKLKGNFQDVFNKENSFEANADKKFNVKPWQYLVFEK
ncbi:MAG: alpha-glucosidase C-terminal domain-containing protein [Ferruginibacter sp.]|nr:alpha-glucosidase C-terminal domain-containing protein [Ferruginibacter sp.]MBP6371577.1 alpha-glucosidase C-terminal domain-containing protein [Ferruginibacter sp.]MBP6987817.1 alpha-glucosidase C-terminal domain-containing protein [Ferruginibacter sp.]MBP7717827.1 alpha-glucosidase C-terminal domain-containing protein [Ferruginibacter sp.]MBP8610987.1 alpha-glucosidase C-terminal domain-containing protein [Ferruginibacter sp.]